MRTLRLACALALGFGHGVVQPQAADRLTLEGALVQGALIIGRTLPGTTVAFDGRIVRVSPAGEFVLGFGRDAAEDGDLVLGFRDGTSETRTLRIGRRNYDIQHLDGLPERQVTPSPTDLDRIRRENELIFAARAQDLATPWFANGFVWPAPGLISGVYGSQRILNGQPRRPHFGVDIAAPTGTPVVAAAAGIVALARADTFFNGHLVIVDHGHGVSTTYAHLAEITVRTGESIARGQMLGRVGATGRVTGPHLHWGLNWFELPLDPALVVPPPVPASGDGARATVPAARESSPR